MTISAADKKDALDGYLHYSRVLDTDGLQQFYDDLDFTDLCNVRALLDDIELSQAEALEVQKADSQLTSSFDFETLEQYASYYPELPIREWWS